MPWLLTKTNELININSVTLIRLHKVEGEQDLYQIRGYYDEINYKVIYESSLREASEKFKSIVSFLNVTF